MRYHDQCNLAICHTVPLRVYFTWQCAMRYHDQCNLAMCHAVPQPVYFTWQCLIRYQNQCLSPGNGSCVPRPVQPGNVSYGTTTSVFPLAMCYAYHDQCNLAICNTVPQPVYFIWQCVIRYHDQCSLAICHTVPQPVYFTWQCVLQ